jgi:hypothetical protein
MPFAIAALAVANINPAEWDQHLRAIVAIYTPLAVFAAYMFTA